MFLLCQTNTMSLFIQCQLTLTTYGPQVKHSSSLIHIMINQKFTKLQCLPNICFQQMKNLAQYKYRILRLDSDDAANMLYVNGRLIHRSRDEIGEKSYSVCIHIYVFFINNLLKYLKHQEILFFFVMYFSHFSPVSTIITSMYNGLVFTHFSMVKWMHDFFPCSIKTITAPSIKCLNLMLLVYTVRTFSKISYGIRVIVRPK